MIRMRRWRKDDVEDCAAFASDRHDLIVVDPGNDGMVAVYPAVRHWDSTFRRPRWYHRVQGGDLAVDAARGALQDLQKTHKSWVEHSTLVCETSYGGGRGNAGGDIILARNAGIVIGALLACIGPGFLDVVLVPPSTWQKVLGLKGRVKRPERKAAAQSLAEMVFHDDTRWARAASNVRDPLADTLCMAAWWAGVVRSRGPTAAMVQGPDVR